MGPDGAQILVVETDLTLLMTEQIELAGWNVELYVPLALIVPRHARLEVGFYVIAEFDAVATEPLQGGTYLA